MSSLAKTDWSSSPDALEIKTALPPKNISYLPVNKEKNLSEAKKLSPSNFEIPITKWIMPKQPQGYLAAKQNDIL